MKVGRVKELRSTRLIKKRASMSSHPEEAARHKSKTRAISTALRQSNALSLTEGGTDVGESPTLLYSANAKKGAGSPAGIALA